MGRNSNYNNGGQRLKDQNRASGKPRLTHFLCLPLVNATSISQLVASLEEFRSSIPLVFDSAAERAANAGHIVRVPLVPEAAHRPLGTLHLTLGVMSLPTQEKLDEALNFLQSLDLLSMMREVEAEVQAQAASSSGGSAATDPPLPLTIDLTSLHALPSVRAATILHASPVDPTSRLYPFCVALRNKFIEAGFIHQEMIKAPRGKRRSSPSAGAGAAPLNDVQDLSDDGEVDVPVIRTAEGPQETEGRIPRPLLLHATISNTIYAPKRWQGGDRGGGARRDRGYRKRKEVIKFDATDLLARFGDPPDVTSPQQSRLARKAIPRNMPFEPEEEVQVTTTGGSQSQELKETKRSPFIWARGIVLDRLCICEMGAKPVPYDELKGGPKLGEEYTVVGERSLDFARMMA
ncbi:hypothetical protein VTO42DRAFT_5007 [Malbranchea cinnamomea]